MKILDIQQAMQTILLYYLRGYVLWLGFDTSENKIPSLNEKFALELGTHEPAWRRHDRKSRGIPNATAIASKIATQPGLAEIILMATANARLVKHDSPYVPFLRQQWRDDLPRVGYYEMVHMPREANGKLVWTWRIRKAELDKMEKYLIQLCNMRDLNALRRETEAIVRHNPMFSGVRSQIRRMLRHVQRKTASMKMPYSGPDPENLPIMRKFQKAANGGGGAAGALPASQTL